MIQGFFKRLMIFTFISLILVNIVLIVGIFKIEQNILTNGYITQSLIYSMASNSEIKKFKKRECKKFAKDKSTINTMYYEQFCREKN